MCISVRSSFSSSIKLSLYELGHYTNKTIISKQNSNEDEAQHDLSPRKQRATSKPSGGKQTFRLRVALRSAASTQKSTDEEEEGEEGKVDEKEAKKVEKRVEKKRGKKNQRRVKFEDEEAEAAETHPPPVEERGDDSGEEVSESFLAKRAQNIKANKAMVKQQHRPTYTEDLFKTCCPNKASSEYSDTGIM